MTCADDHSLTASVIIAVHNRHEFLDEALDSVRAQTLAPAEIIIVDDGSTRAETIAYLDQLQEAGAATVHRIKNRGLAGARNEGRRLATGSALLFLDDDDVILPQYLELAVGRLAADPGTDVVYCNAEFFGAFDGPWELPPYDPHSIVLDNMVFSSAVIRASRFDAVGGYDATFRRGREDHELWIRMTAQGAGFHRLEPTLFRYRQTDTSMQKSIGTTHAAMAETYAEIVRRNPEIYLDNIELLWEEIFSLRGEVKRLRGRYGRLDDLLRTGRQAQRTLMHRIEVARDRSRGKRGDR